MVRADVDRQALILRSRHARDVTPQCRPARRAGICPRLACRIPVVRCFSHHPVHDSSQMIRALTISLAAACVACLAPAAHAAPARPPITGVSHIAVYSSNRAASEHFYVHDLGAIKGSDPENARGGFRSRCPMAPTGWSTCSSDRQGVVASRRPCAGRMPACSIISRSVSGASKRRTRSSGTAR